MSDATDPFDIFNEQVTGFPINQPATGDFDPTDPEALDKAAEEQRRDQAIAQVEIARLYHDVFMTGRGPELLDLFRTTFLTAPLMRISHGNPAWPEFPISPAEWAFVREGQNSLIRHIERMIALATQPEVKANG